MTSIAGGRQVLYVGEEGCLVLEEEDRMTSDQQSGMILHFFVIFENGHYAADQVYCIFMSPFSKKQ